MANSADNICYEKTQYMVSLSPNGYVRPSFRAAHILKPGVSASAIERPKRELPPYHPPSDPTISRPPNLPLTVKFNGWRNPMRQWESWVVKMCAMHRSTWKEAGIYDPIMASRYSIQKNEDLITGLAQKWCSETNTFVFKWGEATISLEDIMILGGYSVSGSCVRIPIGGMAEVIVKLTNVRLLLNQSISKKASHNAWMNYFMEEETDIEHEAFLSLWLSRSLFPTVFDTVDNHIFALAAHLARGTRVALAPAVLAAIYRDLGLLKAAIRDHYVSELTLWAPFQFLQAWIWERFVSVRPGADYIEPGMPRLSRWRRKYRAGDNVFDLDSSAGFQWRPYTKTLQNWAFPKFYAERETRVRVSPDMDTEFKSFALCIRASELVGHGITQKYSPHRVAMQFGIDQDIPENLPRCNGMDAWNDYARNISDADLYIPSRLFKSDVTIRYAEWRTNSHVPQFTPMIPSGSLPAPPGISHKLGVPDFLMSYDRRVEIQGGISSDEEMRQ